MPTQRELRSNPTASKFWHQGYGTRIADVNGVAELVAPFVSRETAERIAGQALDAGHDVEVVRTDDGTWACRGVR